MYLHNDKDLFEEVINETNSRTGIAESIIEKDYNYYLFGYQPVSDYPSEEISSGVKLETALVSYSFPT